MLSSMSGRTLVLPAAAPRRVTAKPVKAVASSDVSQKLGSTAAAASLALLVTLGAADFAEARTVSPYAGLTPCAGNAAFAKREKQEVKGLTKRLAKVRAGARGGRRGRNSSDKGRCQAQPTGWDTPHRGAAAWLAHPRCSLRAAADTARPEPCGGALNAPDFPSIWRRHQLPARWSRPSRRRLTRTRSMRREARRRWR